MTSATEVCHLFLFQFLLGISPLRYYFGFIWRYYKFVFISYIFEKNTSLCRLSCVCSVITTWSEYKTLLNLLHITGMLYSTLKFCFLFFNNIVQIGIKKCWGDTASLSTSFVCLNYAVNTIRMWLIKCHNRYLLWHSIVVIHLIKQCTIASFLSLNLLYSPIAYTS